MKTAFRKRSPQWKFLKTLFWRVRVDRRKRNFSKTLRLHYQFQSTTRNIRNLFNMAGRALPFPVVYTWAYFKPNCLFLSRFSFVNSSSWLIQEAAEHYQVTFATGVKRPKVGSPCSLTLFLPGFWHFKLILRLRRRSHQYLKPHQRNSKIASIFYFAGS